MTRWSASIINVGVAYLYTFLRHLKQEVAWVIARYTASSY